LKPESVWVDRQPPPAEAKVLSCEYVQTWARTFVSHDWHVQPFVKDRSAFPPERCAFRSAV